MKLTDEKILGMAIAAKLARRNLSRCTVAHRPDTDIGLELINFARAILKEAGVEELERDAERLNWMVSRGAHVSWSRDGELCNVWLPAEDEEDARPAEGYPQKCYDSPREAIDQVMKAK